MDYNYDEDAGRPLPAKRKKRGKYVSKACFQCQKRKIKCDGKRICGPCVEKGRACVRQTPVQSPGRRATTSHLPGPTTPSENQDNSQDADARAPNIAISPGDAVLRRLAYLEEQLRDFQPVAAAPRAPGEREVSANRKLARKEVNPSLHGSTDVSSSKLSHHTGLQPDSATFEGESSMAYTLTELEDRLEQEGVTIQTISTNPSSLPLTPSASSYEDDHTRASTLDHIRLTLRSQNDTSTRKLWDGYVQTFLTEVHVLYPFLHPFTLHERYLGIWRYLDGTAAEHAQDDQRASAAQVLLCLALGRCETGSRTRSAEVRHAAGWSLFSAASDLLGDPMNIFTKGWSALLVFQNLVLMVVYLFRLDANNRASKLVALTVLQAHQMGLHREAVLSRMPVFEAEMFRRLWWCLYILDRRVALETGCPYVIQDYNTDTRFPSELNDDTLSHVSRNRPWHINPDQGVQAELSTGSDSLIPYLAGMIHYSRIVANVWETLHRARGSDTHETGWNPVTHDHLDFLISSAERQMPSVLTGDLGTIKSADDGRDWWKAKQRHLMRMRWNFLRLSIRRPMARRSTSTPFRTETNIWEDEYICIRLVQSIFDQFSQLAEDHVEFQFPFLHYLARTAMIALGLIVKQPSFRQSYGMNTLAVIRDIKVCCGKTWVSGKFMRSVNKLNEIGERVLGQPRFDRAGASPAPVQADSGVAQKHAHAARPDRIRTPLGDSGETCSPPARRAATVDRSQRVYSTATAVAVDEENYPVTDGIGPASPFSLKPPTGCKDNSGSSRTESAPSRHSSLTALVDLVTQDFDFEESIGNCTPGSLPLCSFGASASLGLCEVRDGTSRFWENQGPNTNETPYLDFAETRSPASQQSRNLKDTGLGNGSDWPWELLGNGMSMDVFMQW